MSRKNVEEFIVEIITCNSTKFSHYVLKPSNANGKDKIFIDLLGYRVENEEDARELVKIYTNQVTDKFRIKDYELGRKDEYGQRFTIIIEVRGKKLKSGWILKNGELKLATPFVGYGN